MRTLDEVTVVVPDLSDGEEWVEAEQEVEPAEVPVLRVQRLMAGLLAEARPPEDFPRPVLIAWLMLWTRVFQGLEGLRGAAIRHSLYSARVMSRVLFETQVQLRAIARNLTDPESLLPVELKRRSVEDRLHAYLAWSIHQDMTEWRYFSRPKNLSEIYDPRPAREYERAYGDIIRAGGALFGHLETLTDAEAEIERQEAESVARRKIDQYGWWLQDERLIPFLRRLEGERHNSFFSFIDPKERSLQGALAADGIPYAYGTYSRGSAVVHGTTLEGVLATGGKVLSPQIWADDDSIASEVEQGLSWGRNALLGLYITRPRYVTGTAGT